MAEFSYAASKAASEVTQLPPGFLGKSHSYTSAPYWEKAQPQGQDMVGIQPSAQPAASTSPRGASEETFTITPAPTAT